MWKILAHLYLRIIWAWSWSDEKQGRFVWRSRLKMWGKEEGGSGGLNKSRVVFFILSSTNSFSICFEGLRSTSTAGVRKSNSKRFVLLFLRPASTGAVHPKFFTSWKCRYELVWFGLWSMIYIFAVALSLIGGKKKIALKGRKMEGGLRRRKKT